jgi:hypothetical protein
VQVENLTRLPLPQNPAAVELRRLLARLRWRLGLERLVQAAIRGVFASSFALIVVALAVWLFAGNPPAQSWLWLAAAPLLTALAFALARWPSPRQTALAADRRLGLEDRLATALELSQSDAGGRFDRAQVRDAVTRGSSVASSAGWRTWLALDVRTRNEALIAAAVLVAAASLVFTLPMLQPPVALSGQPGTDLASGAAATEIDSVPLGATTVDLASAASAGTTAAPAPADLASRVQQEAAERAALDKLAQGLGSVSAGQGAADAIQRGDFGSAHDQIQSLGDEADQLSDAAKQQLARGLQQAAAASQQSDRALANAEQQAAQALSRSTYNDQRQALSGLADQVERSGARSVPADQLERDQGQLQQQQQQQLLQQQPQTGVGQSGAAVRSQSPSAGQPNASTANAGTTTDQGAQTASTAGGVSDSSNAGAQQGGAGIGTGDSPDPFSNQPARLDTSGQQVQVPTRLGDGTRVRPADGTEDPGATDPALGGQSVAEQAQAQQTGEVTPEQNLVPGEQRPVVRGYFR